MVQLDTSSEVSPSVSWEPGRPGGEREAPEASTARRQKSAYRPARPPRTSPPAAAGDTSGLTRRNALTASPGFSTLPDVRRPSDGLGVDLAYRPSRGASVVIHCLYWSRCCPVSGRAAECPEVAMPFC
jgi:hypothetical protein